MRCLKVIYSTIKYWEIHQFYKLALRIQPVSITHRRRNIRPGGSRVALSIANGTKVKLDLLWLLQMTEPSGTTLGTYQPM